MNLPLPHDDAALDARLARLGTAVTALDTPAGVELALMRAFHALHPAPRPWYRRLNLPEWSAAGVGALVSAAVVAVLLTAPPPARQAGEPGSIAGWPPASDEGAAFVVLDDALPEDAVDAQLVETELPRTLLAGLGVALTPDNADQAVRAEMLVSAAGEPLALRLTSID
jgi:hypothetical protein